MSAAAFERALEQQLLLPILRMDDAGVCLGFARTLAANGFGLLEITLDTPDACGLIAQLAAEEVWIGAGTVITAADAEVALEHGARFLVSPGLNPEVAQVAASAGVPYLPGVLSPSEAMQALALGLKLLKLFPASLGGPAYLQQLKGPFPQLRWLVTGGVRLEDLPDWRRAGALAIGYGPRLVSARHLQSHDWNAVAAELGAIRQKLDT
ncbi:MAG TPA: bifunctional 4-hydroxy-2-oxoglutarate aldolase/2-dehydro-3-deoxy-phosphogluconate aldolase [Candidatus Obscuribacterales bacterium]